MIMNLDTFLKPKSIAIIGASRNRRKLGYQILDNLKSSGFSGKLYPVNLEAKKISGLMAYKNIQDIKSRVDLAVIVIPAGLVVSEIENCARAGVKNIIIISSGFAEAGREGKKAEREISRLAARYKLNILGPNCLGIINGTAGINATFARASVKGGKIALISQSGAIGSAILDWLQDKNIGFSYFISLGNKAGLSENDFFKYFSQDKQTEMVVAYLEEIERGREFMEIVARLSRLKPVAILAAGKTAVGRRAAFSHTGSLAGAAQAVGAGLRRVGAIGLENLEELFNLTKFFSKKIGSGNNHLYLVSNAGGPVVTTVDILNKQRLVLGKFSRRTAENLKRRLPELVNVNNPLDIRGDAGADRYRRALETVLADRQVKNLLVLLTPQTATAAEETASIIAALGKKHSDKLICASFIGGQSLAAARKILADSSVIDFDYPNQAIRCLGQISGYQLRRRSIKPYKRPVASVRLPAGLKPGPEDYLDSLKLLNHYGIKTAKTFLIKSERDLRSLKYPLVLKVAGLKIIHKTENNCVALDIKNAAAAGKAYRSFKKALAGGNYCLAQEMITDGAEIIVGFKRDQSFGPVIIVGQGGIYTEVFNDIQLEVDDVNAVRAREMIRNLKIYPVLAGVRGQAGFDIKSLAATVVKVARLARENPAVQELDINPLFVGKKGALAADVRIIR